MKAIPNSSKSNPSAEENAEELDRDVGLMVRELIPFSTYRVRISENSWTMPEGTGEEVFSPDLRMKTLLDRAGGSLWGKRILDLGCNKGGCSVYMAHQGAKEVVGVEAREINYRRCVLLKKLLKLDNVTFHRSDVKNVRREWLGDFDIVFAAGILYHLDDPYTFLDNILKMTKGFLLLDTHVDFRDTYAHGCSDKLVERIFDGESYHGRWAIEYEPQATQQYVESLTSAAWSNPQSFWLLEESLVRIIMRLGFMNVSKVYNTPGYTRCDWGCPENCRIILVAKKDWTVTDPPLENSPKTNGCILMSWSHSTSSRKSSIR
jgi:2-polyprenyl-3-methyl-5-hydroxy-6-metoxy-1,4-benzoquinol methylase